VQTEFQPYHLLDFYFTFTALALLGKLLFRPTGESLHQPTARAFFCAGGETVMGDEPSGGRAHGVTVDATTTCAGAMADAPPASTAAESEFLHLENHQYSGMDGCPSGTADELAAQSIEAAEAAVRTVNPRGSDRVLEDIAGAASTTASTTAAGSQVEGPRADALGHLLSATPFCVTVRRDGKQSEQLPILVDRSLTFEWRKNPFFSFVCPLNCGESVPVEATTDEGLLQTKAVKAWTNHRGRYHDRTKAPPQKSRNSSKALAWLPRASPSTGLPLGSHFDAFCDANGLGKLRRIDARARPELLGPMREALAKDYAAGTMPPVMERRSHFSPLCVTLKISIDQEYMYNDDL
jgi:hypothetical protein